MDDNLTLCRRVKGYPEPLGYDVSLAHTGPDGLKEVPPGDFDAVMLPGLDGFAALKQIRTQSAIQVLMLTGLGPAPRSAAWT